MRPTRSAASPEPRWPVRSALWTSTSGSDFAYAGAGLGRDSDLDVVERSEGATRRGRADVVLHLRAVPSADAPGPRPGRALVVPDRGIDGRVVGALPPRSTGRVGLRGRRVAFVAFASAVLFGRLFASRVLFGMGRRMTILVAGFGSLIGGTIAVAADQVFVVALRIPGARLHALRRRSGGVRTGGRFRRGPDERDRRRHHRRLHRVHLEPAVARVDRPELQPAGSYECHRHRDARHHRRRLARTS